MAIQFVSQNAGAGGGGIQVIPAPAGLTPDESLMVLVMLWNVTDPAYPPTDWLLEDGPQGEWARRETIAVDATTMMSVWTAVYRDGDFQWYPEMPPNTWTPPPSNLGSISGGPFLTGSWCGGFNGVDLDAPLDCPAQAGIASGNQHIAPPLVTQTNGAVQVAVWAADGNTNVSLPSGLSAVFDTGADHQGSPRIEGGHRVIASAGNTGTLVATKSGQPKRGWILSLALRPA